MDLSTWKLIISRRVVFDESTFPFAKEPPAPVLAFVFLFDGDMDIVPCLTNLTAHGTPPADAPSSMDVELPQPLPGGRGPVPPLQHPTSLLLVSVVLYPH